MTVPTDAIPTQPQSELAAELVANGASAQMADMDAIMALIDKQQKSMALMTTRLKQLEEERGVPSDPIQGAKQNLVEHLKARMAQYPQLAATELKTVLEKLPEELTSTHTSLIKELVDEVVANHAQIAHDLSYFPALARTLSKVVLEGEAVLSGAAVV